MSTRPEPPELSPKQALQMLQDDPRALLVDIRSTMEFLFVGHPKGAVHVAWIDEPDWDVNPHFVAEIRKLLLGGAVCDSESGCAPVILICRSGKRSEEAGRALLEAGLKNVYHVDEGFEGDLDDNHQRGNIGGWRFHGLPWEQC
jgi:rhodanese-related sulfurtransferase